MDGESVKTNILDSIKQIYGILEFSPMEIDAALDDFCGINQSELIAEIINDLSEAEVLELNACLSPEFTDSGRGKIEEMIKKHFLKQEFAAKSNEAAEKSWREYAAYLKTLGNASQREKIDRVLAGG